MSQQFRGRGRGDRGGDRGGGRGGGRGRGGAKPPAEIFQATVPANLPKRLTDASQGDLIKAFKKLKVTPDRPLRPGFGTLGVPSAVRTNFFALKYPKGPYYDYVVEISPKIEIGRMIGRVFELLEEQPEIKPFITHIAHDRAQRLVSARELPQPLSTTLAYFEDDEKVTSKNRRYTVTVKFERKLDLAEFTRYINGDAAYRSFDVQPYLSAFNLILTTHAAHTGVRVGRNKYFFPDQSTSKLSPGVDAWRGYFVSVRPSFQQLMVNVNVCMTAFIAPGNLAEALKSFRSRQGSLPTLPSRFAKSIKPYVSYLKSKRNIKAIGTTTARRTMFDCEEYGGKISVEEYFKRKHNVKLKYPDDLPVVDIGSKNRNVWVPAELCEIRPGNPLRGRLDDIETAQMIRLACKPPATNAMHITREGFPKMGLGPKREPLSGFGLEINADMAVVPLRILPAPTVQYSPGGGRVNVNNAGWNTTESSFINPAGSGGWGVLVVVEADMNPAEKHQIQALATRFRERCVKNGMKLGVMQPIFTEPLPPPDRDPGREKALDIIHSALKGTIHRLKAKPAFLLVMLSKVDNFIYPGVKRICDVLEGVPALTMLFRKVVVKSDNQQDQYVGNVALKLNAKLGGRNHGLDPRSMEWLKKKKTMIVGVDVTHPSPTTRFGTPSIAAVVANIDDHFAQFPASLRIQKPDPNRESKEIVDELGAMLIERLLAYFTRNKCLPDRILIFRDGVSEGQFDIVITEELSQIQKACTKLAGKSRDGKKYAPTVSIIICGKRHHARFYAPKSELASQNGNTKPGSVSDQGITAIFDFDFYLQPHAALQGTVRPTHYTVVYDQNGLGADEVQQGAHTFSYMYARATKAVSLIPPAYYADLACERGRCYLNKFFVDDGGRSDAGRKLSREEQKDRTFQEAKQAWGEGVHPSLQNTMFYI